MYDASPTSTDYSSTGSSLLLLNAITIVLTVTHAFPGVSNAIYLSYLWSTHVMTILLLRMELGQPISSTSRKRKFLDLHQITTC